MMRIGAILNNSIHDNKLYCNVITCPQGYVIFCFAVHGNSQGDNTHTVRTVQLKIVKTHTLIMGSIPSAEILGFIFLKYFIKRSPN